MAIPSGESSDDITASDRVGWCGRWVPIGAARLDRPPGYLAYLAYLAYQVTRSFGMVADVAQKQRETVCSVLTTNLEFSPLDTL